MAATPPCAAEGIPPTSFGDAIAIVQSFLSLDDAPPRTLLLRARQELELPEPAVAGTLRQQLQHVLQEIGMEDVVHFSRSPAVDPPSPPAALAARDGGSPGDKSKKARPQTVLRQAVATAEMGPTTRRSPAADAVSAAEAAAAEKKKLEQLVQKMIVKHQSVLVERTIAVDARADAEAELARLRGALRDLEKAQTQAARTVELQQTVAAKEMELERLQGKIKEYVGAAKSELDKKQAQLTEQVSASDLLQLRLAAQRATCVAALRSRAVRALSARCFFAWARGCVVLARGTLLLEDPHNQIRSSADISEARDPAVLCEKFRSLVSGTFAGHRVEVLFDQHDQDRDGRWSWDEFRRAVRSSAHVTEFAMCDAELRAVFDERDENGIGLITVEQLRWLLFPLVHSPSRGARVGNSPTDSTTPQRRLKPPGKANSVAMSHLRRSAAAANRRVREFEAAAEQRAVLVGAMRGWRTSVAAAHCVRVVTTLLGNLCAVHAIQSTFKRW